MERWSQNEREVVAVITFAKAAWNKCGRRGVSAKRPGAAAGWEERRWQIQAS